MMGRGVRTLVTAWIGLASIAVGCGSESKNEGGAAGSPANDGGDASPTAGSSGSGPGGAAAGGSPTGGSSGSGPGPGGAGAGFGGTVDAGGSDGATEADSGNCTPAIDGASCRPKLYPASGGPLDIYIMFDQTGSTCICIEPADADVDCATPDCTTTRMQALRTAATAFLEDPESIGIGVGIGYFGDMPIGQASCDPADYEDAAVGISELPGNASALIQSLDGVEPTGETPTGPAIRGACRYTRQWKLSHPEHEVVILLLTDGQPEADVSCPTNGCCPTLPDAVLAANECFVGDPAVRTYVLGVGPRLQELEQLAVAGGTQRAYFVESADVTEQVFAALRAIRSNASRCELMLPKPAAGEALDPATLNLYYEVSPCEYRLIPKVSSPASCGDPGGWYYDDPINPTKVRLCPRSCDELSDPRMRLTFTAGCSAASG